MDVRFSGVFRVTGLANQVNAYLRQIPGEDAPLSAYTDDTQTHAVLVTGKDSIQFVKTEYGLKIPPEFEGKSYKEMRALGKGNPDPEIREKFREVALQVVSLWDKLGTPELCDRLTRYYETTKAAGKDAEGNPVQDISL